jgi:hypothetical protein
MIRSANKRRMHVVMMFENSEWCSYTRGLRFKLTPRRNMNHTRMEIISQLPGNFALLFAKAVVDEMVMNFGRAFWNMKQNFVLIVEIGKDQSGYWMEPTTLPSTAATKIFRYQQIDHLD